MDECSANNIGPKNEPTGMSVQMNKYNPILILISLLLVIANTAGAQKGFKVIDKAEQKYEQGDDQRALRLLSKAEKMNYGFCGNAWMEAGRAINLLRAKIHMDQEEFQLARNCLDSIRWEYRSDNLDSIRIKTYQMEYGSDSLSNMIDASLQHTNVECGTFDCFVDILLTNGQHMKLKINHLNNGALFVEEDESRRTQLWLEKFKASENYKMIKEKT